MEKEPARLSGGQKQRAGIAGVRCIASSYLLLLDEATVCWSQGRQEVLLYCLKRLKKKLSNGDFDYSWYLMKQQCYRVIVIKNGRNGTKKERAKNFCVLVKKINWMGWIYLSWKVKVIP